MDEVAGSNPTLNYKFLVHTIFLNIRVLISTISRYNPRALLLIAYRFPSLYSIG